MATKPVHRRRAMIAADDVRPQRWRIAILPTILFIQSVFVGSAFGTLGFTMLVFASAASLVVAIVYLMGGYDGLTKDIVQSASESATRSKGLNASRSGKKHDSQGSRRKSASFTKAEAMRKRRARFRLIRKFASPILLLLITLFGVLSRVDAHVSGNMNFVAMIVDSVAHGTLFVSLGFWVLNPYHGHPAMLACGLIAMLMTVTGGGVSHTISGQLVAALATLAGYLVGAEHILSRTQLFNSIRKRQKLFTRRLKSREQRFNNGMHEKAKAPLPISTVSINSGDKRSPMLFYILAFSLLLMSTTAAGHIANNMVPGLRVDLLDRLSDSLERVAGGSMIGSSRYVRGSRLGQIRRHMVGDPKEIALRAFAENEPGYLRGTVFDTYRRGAWAPMTERTYKSRTTDVMYLRSRFVDPNEPAETPLKRGGDQDDRLRFSVRKNPESDIVGTVEVHNVPMKGQFVFSALSTEWIEASVYGIRLTHQDVITQGVDTQRPYVLGIGPEPPFEELPQIRRNVMLQVPATLRGFIKSLSEDVCDGRLTARSKAKAIEDYFQNNFKYSLDSHPSPRDVDPVAHFLTSKHPAHCEFFASAAALMLRTVNVPTRYVTGYVMSELSDDREYYIARNRDAHAWIEAYDDITERWFPVEATVGRSYRTFSDPESLTDELGSASDGFFEETEERSILARLTGWLLSFRTSDSLTFLFQVAQLPMFGLVVILLWFRHRRKLMAFGDPAEYESRQMLSRVDRRLRKHSLVRGPGETLHQFAMRVEQAADESTDPQLLSRIATWYRRFADDRYQGKMPEPLGA
ncbi:transglutaminase-like domain-containing protein [Stieleria sp. JC731]|uniref:transglutaminase-like domain-containing protein n=1 Tax=Pirellulaceae TaxID=2691357 RepID=UPI001E64C7F3|nr:transglutaminase-like domain-containing protein [Stieleria sp. JC731]MCC9602695.1 transglutaminase-like domain-containing protein [Stieleria sp. JC731]